MSHTSYIKELSALMLSAKEVSTDSGIPELFGQLYSYERKFATYLQSLKKGSEIYREFLRMVSRKKGQLKTARPYFREYNSDCLPRLSRAVAEKNVSLLYNIPINFQFCKFVVEHMRQPGKVLLEHYRMVSMIREKIITQYLHLALNRAKVFSRQSSVNLSDLIQSANEGLILAVDKYVLTPEAPPFYQVAIGRMLAPLIVTNSGNMALSVGAGGRRTLYRIKKVLESNSSLTDSEISAILGVAEQEITALRQTLRTRSLFEPAGNKGDVGDRSLGSPNKRSLLIDYLAEAVSDNNDVEKQIEKKEMLTLLKKFFSELSVLEQKVLALKGVCFE